MRIGVPRGHGNGQAATIAMRIDGLKKSPRQAPVSIRKPLQQANGQARNATRADGNGQRQRPAFQYQPISRTPCALLSPPLNAQPWQLVPPGPKGRGPLIEPTVAGSARKLKEFVAREDRRKNEQ